MSKPITPDEVLSKKKVIIPPEVFDAFNELIAENWDGIDATVLLKEVSDLIVSKLKLTDDTIIYKKKYLDIEELYREAGWDVKYDQPAYNETFKATFIFSKKK